MNRDSGWASNVSNPTLRLYLPSPPTEEFVPLVIVRGKPAPVTPSPLMLPRGLCPWPCWCAKDAAVLGVFVPETGESVCGVPSPAGGFTVILIAGRRGGVPVLMLDADESR